MPMGKTTNNREEVGHQDNTVVTVRDKHSEHKTKGIRRGSQPAFNPSCTANESTTSDNELQVPNPNNVLPDLQPPEAPMDTAYEMFVRSANEAHCFATAQDRKAVKTFNKRVRRL